MKLNLPREFERAWAATIRAHADVDTLPRLRPYQSLREIPELTQQADRALPCIDIRASPPSPPEQGVARFAMPLTTGIVTSADDDWTHATMADAYAAVMAVAELLYRARHGMQDSEGHAAAVNATFDRSLEDAGVGAVLDIVNMGIEWGAAAVQPQLEMGANYIAFDLIFHFARKDW